MGIAPPPGILPPFAPQSRPAAPKEAKATAAQQTIKVEIGEEIHEERKKAKRNAAIAALFAAAVGAGLGWVAGGSSEKGGRLTEAARGAGLLEVDLKASYDKMKELDDKLAEAKTQLAAKTFPDGLAAALGGLNVPFDATNLDGKNVGSLSGKIMHSLLAFTSDVEALNADKDTLKNTLPSAMPVVNKIWKEEKEPVANFAVVFSGGDKKVAAELVQIKEPFAWKGDYPGNITIVKVENGKPADKKATRWVKGDLTGSDPVAIPIEPKSIAGLTSDQSLRALSVMIDKMQARLKGNPDDPQNPKPGLLKQGDDIAADLHKICSASKVCAEPAAKKP
jgi:hypothetical protein